MGMCKFVLIFLLISTAALGQTPLNMLIAKKASATVKYCRSITVDKTKVPNTDQTDFPVLVSGTYSYLATVANGGKVRDVQGDDIIFYTGGCGVETLLKWQLERWNPVTGEIQAWVKVPTLTTATNYVFYIGYGDVARTTFAGDNTGTWNSAFIAVMHFGDGTTLSATDATTNANNGTITGATAIAGQIDGGANFNGTSDKIVWSGISPGTSFTISGWIFPTSASDPDGALLSQGSTRGLYFDGSTRKFDYYQAGAHLNTSALTYSNWYHFAVVSNGIGLSFYRNGVADGTAVLVALAPTLTNMGDDGAGDNYKGIVDEIKVSNTNRSADWIATEYNNQSSPSTFYTVGSETSI